jgi:hypothetical protein
MIIGRMGHPCRWLAAPCRRLRHPILGPWGMGHGVVHTAQHCMRRRWSCCAVTCMCACTLHTRFLGLHICHQIVLFMQYVLVQSPHCVWEIVFRDMFLREFSGYIPYFQMVLAISSGPGNLQNFGIFRQIAIPSRRIQVLHYWQHPAGLEGCYRAVWIAAVAGQTNFLVIDWHQGLRLDQSLWFGTTPILWLSHSVFTPAR